MPTTTSLNDVDLATVAGLVAKIQEQPDVAATRWEAQVTWNGAFRSQAQVRDFDPIPSDEPAALGGGDTAANPVEQLLAALGNCLAVGYAANATAAGIEVRHLSIDVEGDLDLHTFLNLDDGNAGFGAVRATVHLDADASPAQLADLHAKVTGTSPVGHTLARPVPLQIDLA
jgi:uncharacterized OsmC-like protein